MNGKRDLYSQTTIIGIKFGGYRYYYCLAETMSTTQIKFHLLNGLRMNDYIAWKHFKDTTN